MSDFQKAVGERLRELRLMANMTQQQAAQLSGLSAAYICNIEKGVSGGTLPALYKLATAYGRTLADVIGPAENKAHEYKLPITAPGLVELMGTNLIELCHISEDELRALDKIEFRGKRLANKEAALTTLLLLRRM
jgi:transcriptional regulator with XRE-family HTH domain